MTSNRHARRKTAAGYETATATPTEFHKLNSVCAWDGCDEIANHEQGRVYLPKGWTALLVFWSENAPRDILLDIPDSGVRRDTVLCPRHTKMLDQHLKPLPSHLLRETHGNA
jgi:hypothetical protein